MRLGFKPTGVFSGRAPHLQFPPRTWPLSLSSSTPSHHPKHTNFGTAHATKTSCVRTNDSHWRVLVWRTQRINWSSDRGSMMRSGRADGVRHWCLWGRLFRLSLVVMERGGSEGVRKEVATSDGSEEVGRQIVNGKKSMRSRMVSLQFCSRSCLLTSLSSLRHRRCIVN